ncbi:MAG TPA: 50S ribosomal protein L11 methyltransferase [Gemmatimonadaceae bacterium]|nr:50S ribosomal protein L11 methyltransferase [Gemmatimonadaceae bacterium]
MTGDSWHAVRVRPAGDRAAVIAALFAAGSQGIQEDGETIVTHFPPETDIDVVRAGIADADPGASLDVSDAPVVDWSEAWKHGVGAHELGALAIVPPWLAEGRDPARTIVIDPGMAFGTGEHETTRCVIRLLPGVISPGDRVADLGAGSAVLAIAAAKLGASHVAAIELDPEAIANAEENVERNGVADRVTVIEGDAGLLLPLVAPVQVVLANIISSVLVELLPAIGAALTPGGRAVLSGILTEEQGDMLAVLAAEWQVVEEAVEGKWWSVVVARR